MVLLLQVITLDAIMFKSVINSDSRLCAHLFQKLRLISKDGLSQKPKIFVHHAKPSSGLYPFMHYWGQPMDPGNFFGNPSDDGVSEIAQKFQQVFTKPWADIPKHASKPVEKRLEWIISQPSCPSVLSHDLPSSCCSAH